jgi:hypothetical protein
MYSNFPCVIYAPVWEELGGLKVARFSRRQRPRRNSSSAFGRSASPPHCSWVHHHEHAFSKYAKRKREARGSQRSKTKAMATLPQKNDYTLMLRYGAATIQVKVSRPFQDDH